MDTNTQTGSSNFLSNLVSCFFMGFYRRAAKFPLSKAFFHVAGLTAIVAVAIVWTVYSNYRDNFLPTYTDFIEKAIPEELVFEGGKALYDGPSPYEYSDTVFGWKRAVIIDVSEKEAVIPEEYDHAYLISGGKAYSGNHSEKKEIELPEERITARDYFLNSVQRKNSMMFIIMWVNSFTSTFALAAISISVVSIIVFFIYGRFAPGLTFTGQLSIWCFASTPLFAGLMAIHGMPSLNITRVVLGICAVLFLLLGILGTRHVLLAGISESSDVIEIESEETSE